MWLSDKLKDEEKSVVSGHISLQGGSKPVLNGVGKVNSVMPYGVYSLLPMNIKALTVEDYSIGTDEVPENIPYMEIGEICLYSKGGYILVKNNGEIIINGKTLEI